MQLVGITVFTDETGSLTDSSTSSRGLTIDTLDTRTRLALGKRVKSEAIRFLTDNGITLGKHVSYSTLQANQTEFWVNPQVKMLAHDWNIILNDSLANELIVLALPAGATSLRIASDAGLATRPDKPELIDLLINRDTLVDKRSGFDFSPYLQARVRY